MKKIRCCEYVNLDTFDEYVAYAKTNITPKRIGLVNCPFFRKRLIKQGVSSTCVYLYKDVATIPTAGVDMFLCFSPCPELDLKTTMKVVCVEYLRIN